MKKGIILFTGLFLLISGVTFAATAKKDAKAKTAAAQAAARKIAPTPEPTPMPTPVLPAAQNRIESMQPGFDFNGSLDIKMFDMVNANFTTSSKWYFYPTYQVALSDVLTNKVGLYVDVEKPGYADITYPFIKVNEMYAKFKEDNLYVKVGRQVFGDVDDLLLGFQNDAVSVGLNVGKTEMTFFLARVNIVAPWVDTPATLANPIPTYAALESMLGFVPTFNLSNTSKLKAYLMIGMDPSTNQTVNPPTDTVNTLVTVGGRYMLNAPAGANGTFGLNGQLGLQFGMAKTTDDQSIDDTGFGAKIDAKYGVKNEDFGMNLAAHLVFTSGSADPTANTKAGFVSMNSLPGSGPGLFNKIQDGAGPYTFLDAIGGLAGNKVNSYMGLLALGLTSDFSFGIIQPGIGFWSYSNTDNNGKALGIELDVWVAEKVSPVICFYEQLAFFSPNKDGLGVDPNATIESPMKLLIGSSINF